MNKQDNLGLKADEIAKVKAEIKASGTNHLLNEEEPNNEQIAHFFFIGQHEDKEVIYDAVAYTLQIAYDSRIYELAEEEAMARFPSYRPASIDEVTNEETAPQGLTEEVDEFLASRLLELEEEDQVKVSEAIEYDDDFAYGIGLEVALNQVALTPRVIEEFVESFTTGKFLPDETLFSFPSDDEDDE